MNRFVTVIIFAAVLALTAGCASSPQHFYTLNSTPAPKAMQQADYSVSVGPVLIPAAVDRPQIVVRTDPHQVSINDFHRWASPLKDDIARVIVENLIALLGTTQISVFPRAQASDTNYRCIVDILRFDSEPDKAATLDALWKVICTKDGQVHHGRTTLSEPAQGSGFAALVAAHSRALENLSADIAAAIREMESTKR